MDSEISLAPALDAPKQARAWVRAQVSSAGCPEALVDDLVLLTSELVGNAVLHARSPLRLRLIDAGQTLRVEVYDENPRLPTAGFGRLDAIDGRGLQLVAALSRAWGAEPVPGGKRVWCELATPALGGRPVVA